MKVHRIIQNNMSFKMNAIIDPKSAAQAGVSQPDIEYIQSVFSQVKPQQQDVWLQFYTDNGITACDSIFSIGKGNTKTDFFMLPNDIFDIKIEEMAKKLAAKLSKHPPRKTYIM